MKYISFIIDFIKRFFNGIEAEKDNTIKDNTIKSAGEYMEQKDKVTYIEDNIEDITDSEIKKESQQINFG